MLIVRKEGKAHDRYNSFRSAFELLEAVGREPQDCFDERNEDLPPLQKLEQRMQRHMEQRIELLKKDIVLKEDMENRMELLRKKMQKQIDDMRTENEVLRSTYSV